jgi:tubulin polyglutamylase TTLL9
MSRRQTGLRSPKSSVATSASLTSSSSSYSSSSGPSQRLGTHNSRHSNMSNNSSHSIVSAPRLGASTSSNSSSNMLNNRSVNFRSALRNTVLDVMVSRGWNETDHENPASETNWDIFWTDKPWIREHYDVLHLAAHQRINHFPNYFELTRKDMLIKNVKRFRRKLERAGKSAEAAKYNFCPDTYMLPNEYLMFKETFKKNPNAHWIMKPIGKSQGRGIFLFNKLSDISEWKNRPSFWHTENNSSSSNSNSIASSSGAFIAGGSSSSSCFSSFPDRKTANSSNVGASVADSNASDTVVDNTAAAAVAGTGTGAGTGAAVSAQSPSDSDPQQQQTGVERYVVQRYVANPLLIGGKKFDMRIYVLVTSYSPLRAYLYREGFARFASNRFSMDISAENSSVVHLTNVAVQKKAQDYDRKTGGKWRLSSLKQYLANQYGRTKIDQVFTAITESFILSLKAVQPVMINDKHSFELYGYDILLDDEFNVWMLEANASPSLTASTPDDYNIKFALIDDALSIIDMEGKMSGNEIQVGGFDMIYNGKPVVPPPESVMTNKLGSYCDRTRVHKQQATHKRKKNQKAQKASA